MAVNVMTQAHWIEDGFGEGRWLKPGHNRLGQEVRHDRDVWLIPWASTNSSDWLTTDDKSWNAALGQAQEWLPGNCSRKWEANFANHVAAATRLLTYGAHDGGGGIGSHQSAV